MRSGTLKINTQSPLKPCKCNQLYLIWVISEPENQIRAMMDYFSYHRSSRSLKPTDTIFCLIFMFVRHQNMINSERHVPDLFIHR